MKHPIQNMRLAFRQVGWKKWLLYELNPGWYVEKEGPSFRSFFPEIMGWFVGHPTRGIAISFLLAKILSFPTWALFLSVLVISLIIEIIQTLKADFLSPINSTIDIATWLAGVIIYEVLV